MKIRLCYIGKARDPHLCAAAREYLKRASRWVRCELEEIRPAHGSFWDKYAAARKILLDAGGWALDSPQFVGLVRQAEQEGRDLVFLIGGAEGLPAGWRQRADLLLSLSPLTMAHELARVVLAEQIYRALATLHGHPYPR